MLTIQQIIERLNNYWQAQGCLLLPAYDLEKGAGTFNPATFLYSLGKEKANVAYVEPSRRPADGRFGLNPNRFLRFHQYQVLLKPCPKDCQTLYLESLRALGLQLEKHDIRFVHDDWASPTLGASGLGWEVWCDGMEITQFTYFQQVGSIACSTIPCELTYGIERLAMYLQHKESALDTSWNETTMWQDLYKESERQFTQYHLQEASSAFWLESFNRYEQQAVNLSKKKLPLVSYDFVLKCSHAFNSLEALGTLSTTQRAGYIARIRSIAQAVAKSYIKNREELGYPLYEKPIITSPSLKLPSVKKNEDFLIEIGSEELPASYIEQGLLSLKNGIKKLFNAYELSFDKIQSYGTPRRLALLIENLAFETKAKIIEKKGPRLSTLFTPKPTKALFGFLQSVGERANSLEEIQKNPNLFIKKIDDTEYLFAKKRVAPIQTPLIIQRNFPKIIKEISFPKKMRWSENSIEYARPIRWLLILFGSQTIEVAVDELVSSNTTRGHRFLAADPIEINHPSQYESRLETAFVIAQIDKRKKQIQCLIDSYCKKEKSSVKNLYPLLSEVVHLVEYPFLIEGHFDPSFLELPEQLLICEMKEHQRVFAVVDMQKQLLNRFLIITNIHPTKEIQTGNEKVIHSRLYDGKFVYDEDKKQGLKNLREKLKAMVFHKELGTVYDKMMRIVHHVQVLQEVYPEANRESLKQAALDCKTDLASGIVFEFPELQGILGAQLAQIEGKEEKVVQAIQQQYLPMGEQGTLPSSQEGLLLSFADKLDSLIGLFAVDQKPTSSNDPLALRRAAIGISRMIIEYNLPFPLKELIKQLSLHFSFKIEDSTLEEVYQFIVKRFQQILISMDFEINMLQLIRPNSSGDLHDYLLRVKGVHQAMQNSDFKALQEVLKRSNNLAKGQQKLDLQANLFTNPYEKNLFNQFIKIKKEFQSFLLASQYKKALLSLAKLQNPLNSFFEKVRVISEDHKLTSNRLALLHHIHSLSQKIFY